MKPPCTLPEITLDRSSRQPLREQIHSQIASAIRSGTLPDSARLPSSRLLAKLLHVSRNTVVEAYEKLLADGSITTKPSSGIHITHPVSHTIPNFSNLRLIARAAHYPVRTLACEDPDGTALYLNLTR
jgi:DNA-binding transcriptional regulator YhcF (GntR family)